MTLSCTDDPPRVAQPNDDEEERTKMWAEGQAVPIPLFKDLSTAYRGQHIGPEGLKVLNVFNDKTVFTRSLGTPNLKHVRTTLTCKYDQSWTIDDGYCLIINPDEETFLHAERELIDESNPAALRRSQRQSVLDARTVDTIEKKEVTVLDFLLATFFLACAIPWVVVENLLFRAFIKTLRSAYYDLPQPGG
ncbi:hypothetical protein CYMTET_37308 [Cymbomonas tetramitiformis]|uniref:Uncharacterized protein n=1 Tax=Cymbomonas tetramitiformis TaxID=36881 RepID=A0AAE0CE82_9CHLO|nr:hypothetical protein CYMTET_37308 [Cymbomonas tetramitiformis]